MGGCSPEMPGHRSVSEEKTGCYVLPKPAEGCLAACTEYSQDIRAGESITAGNGVTVVVADAFVPADGDPARDGIVCLDFYLGPTRLNDRYVCLTDPSQYPLSRCAGRDYADYGVKIHFWAPQDDTARLRVESYPGIPMLHSARDLYQACVELGRKEGCLAYVPNTALAGEGVLQQGPFTVYYPEQYPTVGQYFFDQLGACQTSLDALYGPSFPAASMTLRHVIDPNFGLAMLPPASSLPPGAQVFPGAWAGASLSDRYNVVFATSAADVADLAQRLEQLSLTPDTCYDGTILHEGGHSRVWAPGGNYLWHPLDEGCQRRNEVRGTAVLEPPVLQEAVVAAGDTLTIAYQKDGETKTALMNIDDISADGVTIGIQLSATLYASTTFPFGEVSHFIVGNQSFGNHVVVDEAPLANEDGAPHALWRVIRFDESFFGLERFTLSCGPTSYSFFDGVQLGGKFYINPLLHAIGKGADQPYVPLDGSVGTVAAYNTGACFWEGIAQEYGSEAAYAGFLTNLRQTLQAYAAQSPATQFAYPFCTLDEIQKQIDIDRGSGTFDVAAYAQRFGYTPEKPWCTALELTWGGDQFGRSVFK